jgi:hypothetical protein
LTNAYSESFVKGLQDNLWAAVFTIAALRASERDLAERVKGLEKILRSRCVPAMIPNWVWDEFAAEIPSRRRDWRAKLYEKPRPPPSPHKPRRRREHETNQLGGKTVVTLEDVSACSAPVPDSSGRITS